MLLFYQFVILIFIFSVIGWMMEVTLKYIQYHRFINRGFMIGPYCPIYGFGVAGVTILVGGFIGRHGTDIETFWAGFVICGFLEYMTSYYMEKMFHARWWDYSNKPMNLHGRIWIGNLILFGIASVFIVKWIAPHYFNFIQDFSPTILAVLAWVIIIAMAADFTISHILMNSVRKEIDTSQGDNTEEISRQIHAMLKNRSVLIRRIYEAYPDFRAIPSRLITRYKAAKQEFLSARKEYRALLKKRFEENFDTEALRKAKEKLEERYEKLHKLTDGILRKF